MTDYKPRRKVMAGSLSGAIAILIISGIEARSEFKFETYEATALVTIISTVTSYLIDENESNGSENKINNGGNE